MPYSGHMAGDLPLKVADWDLSGAFGATHKTAWKFFFYLNREIFLKDFIFFIYIAERKQYPFMCKFIIFLVQNREEN